MGLVTRESQAAFGGSGVERLGAEQRASVGGVAVTEHQAVLVTSANAASRGDFPVARPSDSWGTESLGQTWCRRGDCNLRHTGDVAHGVGDLTW
jgi:hypothetical protein